MKSLRWFAAFALFAAGCGVSSTTNLPPPPKTTVMPAPETGENTTSDSGEESPAMSTTATPVESSGDVTLVDDDGPLFKKYLDENKGKVILVDCWATWCGPCMKGFPHTVDLHKKYQADGLVVVSVSFDDMGDDDEAKKASRDSALDFLKKQNATFKNFLAKTGIGPESGVPFGVSIQLPAFRVIDRQGKDRFKSEAQGEEPLKEIDQLIETLLKEPT
jgi:thiol-disulfide isomerase/thioredoxin